MVRTRILGRFGAGGPSVDTVLAEPVVRPGGRLRGEVRMVGGDRDVTVDRVVVGLVCRVDVSAVDPDDGASVEFHQHAVTGAFTLRAGAGHALPFEVDVPWETPVTEVRERPLPGMAVGVQTRLAVVHAVDETALDAIRVAPAAVHERLLLAFTRLGFSYRDARIRDGRLDGVAQRLPFHQEVAFRPPESYPGWLTEVGVAVVADRAGVDVVLGLAGRPGGRVGRFRVGHADGSDWPAVLDGRLRELLAGGDGQPAGRAGSGGRTPGRSAASARPAVAKRAWWRRRTRPVDETAGPGTHDQPGHSGGAPDGSS
ncbi:sporulation protein [Polymorphospora rubra]|uniref:sporulation protein n=1 Tax=Polymorphospora rubra TaxID=338584 RepID=UPI0033C6FFE2